MSELEDLEEPTPDGRALREIDLDELEIGDIVIVSYRDEQGDPAHFRGRVDHVETSDDPIRDITWIDVSGDGDAIRVMFGGGVFGLDEDLEVASSLGYIAHVELEVDL